MNRRQYLLINNFTLEYSQKIRGNERQTSASSTITEECREWRDYVTEMTIQ